MDDHQADHPAIDVVAPREPERQRCEQGHAGRPERARHRRERRDDEHDPRNQRAPAVDEPRRRFDRPLDGAVGRRNREEIRHADEQHEQVDRKARIHLARGFAREHRPDEERHDQRERAKIDGAKRADDEDRDESDDAGGVDGQVGSAISSSCRAARLVAGATAERGTVRGLDDERAGSIERHDLRGLEARRLAARLIAEGTHGRDRQPGAVPRGGGHLFLRSASRVDRVVARRSVEQVDEPRRRLHVAACVGRELDRQRLRVLRDGKLRPPPRAHARCGARRGRTGGFGHQRPAAREVGAPLG